MSEPLQAIRLGEPRLRFDHSNPTAEHSNPFLGLREHGPYDRTLQETRGAQPIRAVVVGPRSAKRQRAAVRDGLVTDRMGSFSRSIRFHFLPDLVIQDVDAKEEAQTYRRTIAEWLRNAPDKPDMAIVLHREEEFYRRHARGRSPYFAAKASFLPHQVPTQSICLEHLEPRNLNRFRTYYVPNILTAIYAKLGGVPWVVAAGAERPQVTVGVGSTTLGRGPDTRRYIGISTIFRENGSFALWETTPLHTDPNKYSSALQKSVVDSIQTFEKKEGRPVERISCHISGREAGRREIEAVRGALAQMPDRNIEAVVIDISDRGVAWLFDASHESLRPESGFLVPLEPSGSPAFLHTSGRDNSQSRLPVRPLRLTIKAPSPCERWLDEYQHLYDLRWMSWRGVSTAGGPVSVDYPYRMVRLLAGLHDQEGVEAIDVLSRFKEEAWFL